jgi:hypothetical protein
LHPIRVPSPPPAAIPHCIWDGTYNSGLPLAATAVGVANFAVHQHGSAVTFVWHMWGQEHVTGFTLYVDHKRVNMRWFSEYVTAKEFSENVTLDEWSM